MDILTYLDHFLIFTGAISIIWVAFKWDNNNKNYDEKVTVSLKELSIDMKEYHKVCREDTKNCYNENKENIEKLTKSFMHKLEASNNKLFEYLNVRDKK